MSAKETALKKRLLPLYFAAFCHGFVFWYAIEKLFMQSIGFTDAAIGLFVAVYSVAVIITETPSGILADRWSRKGVLILASLALAVSSLIGGLSQSETIYIFSTCLWGVYYALYSGTYDSIVYDTILEEGIDTKRYDYYYGRVNLVDSCALIAGSLIGGLVANVFGLRETYFFTVIPALLAVIALLRFKEPRLHKQLVPSSVADQVRATFRAVLKNTRLLPIIAVLLSSSTILYLLFEFDQLWLLALAAPLVWYGPINAAILSTIGIGGYIAGKFKLYKLRNMIVVITCMLAAGVGLIVSRNLLLTVACIIVICACLLVLEIVFTRVLHDGLSSKIRAGASSAVSTLGRGFIIPLAVLFGYLSEQRTVFEAAWLVVFMLVITAVLVAKLYSENRMLPDLKDGTPKLSIDTYNK